VSAGTEWEQVLGYNTQDEEKHCRPEDKPEAPPRVITSENPCRCGSRTG
jgi:hypothetical protein